MLDTFRSGHAAAVSAAPVRYRLRQTFRYDYDAPARALRHRLVVVPPRRHGDQRLRWGSVHVSDPAAQVDWHADGHGNQVCTVRLAVVPTRLEMHVAVVVDRYGAPRPASRELLSDPRLREATPLTLAGPQARLLAARHAGGTDVLAAAREVCQLVPELVRYSPGSTSVRTTAAQALAGGEGVCQDQAHVMLAICRAAGIACRYVSGHLVGQGGTHAWVEVVVPDAQGARAVAFDPCHGRQADDHYLTVAVGRDYRDVAPTSGIFSGPALGRLTGARELVSEPLAA
jgi:transglutaminase-like putative cysteine protease